MAAEIISFVHDAFERQMYLYLERLIAGVQMRRVVCVSSYTGLIASDEYCAAERIPRPDDALRSCNADCQIRSETVISSSL